MGKGGLVTIAEFARLLGISRQRVTYAANKGKLKTTKVNGVRMVDPKIGMKQWEANRSLVAAAKNPSGKKATKKEGSFFKYESPPKVDQDGDLTMAEAERREKVYKSQLSELKYLEQAGKLIEVDKVQRRAFELGRSVRDAIMQIPTRFAHELAAETDPHKLEIMLTKQLQKVLELLIIKQGRK